MLGLRSRLALGLALAGAGVGCATSPGLAYKWGEAEKYAYAKPIEQVWPEARAYVFEKGWTVKDRSVADQAYYFETE